MICLFNILYDDHYVNKFDVSDTQLTTVVLVSESYSVDPVDATNGDFADWPADQENVDSSDHQAGKFVSGYRITIAELFDEFRTCLEIIIVDTQVPCSSVECLLILDFGPCKLVASTILAEIENDEW